MIEFSVIDGKKSTLHLHCLKFKNRISCKSVVCIKSYRNEYSFYYARYDFDLCRSYKDKDS